MSSALTRRKVDYLFLPFFVIGIVNAAILSLPESLGVPVTADSWWPPLRSLHGWAVEQEPQHLDIPPTLQASILYDGFIQLPMLIVLLIRLWKLKQWPWLPAFGLVYAVSSTTNMYFYFMQTFMGPHPPQHLAVYLPMNIPWALIPLLMIWRFWPQTQAAPDKR